MAASGNPFAGAQAGGDISGGGLGGQFGSGFGPGLAALLQGLFINSGSPYSSAMGPYQQYMSQAAGAQNPFLQAGQGGLQNYQNWLSGMQDPTAFINKTMGQYQQSPWAQYEQNQAMRAGQAAGSAGGLSGSTPLAQQLQQNATNISSGDMQNWLQNVLGINTQYGAGQAGLAGMGQNAANQLSNLYGQQAQGMAALNYGQQAGQNQDFSNILGGLLGIGGSIPWASL